MLTIIVSGGLAGLTAMISSTDQDPSMVVGENLSGRARRTVSSGVIDPEGEVIISTTRRARDL